MNGKSDFGIYQIYGHHPIYGSDSLLYIGKANLTTFSERFKSHQDEWIWFRNKGTIHFYIGRLGGEQHVSIEDSQWSEMIDWAEKLLLNYCTPAMNSSSIKWLHNPDEKEVILRNYFSYNKIPPELSTEWDQSFAWLKNKGDRWKIFTVKQ
ncbi:MAG: hypothetical protein ACHP9Y_04255 [Gammaproteobacteria bacterium]